jgi:hypothetical protein
MPNAPEINISINVEDMSRLCTADSGLPVFIRTALKDRKRTTELTHGFESNLGETNVARSFSMQSDKGLDRWRQISEGN